MPATAKHKHITNNKNWRPFCKQVLEYIKNNQSTTYDSMKVISSMYCTYNNYWPDCDKELAADKKKADDAKADQSKK
jgi:hypothetical protein